MKKLSDIKNVVQMIALHSTLPTDLLTIDVGLLLVKLTWVMLFHQIIGIFVMNNKECLKKQKEKMWVLNHWANLWPILHDAAVVFDESTQATMLVHFLKNWVSAQLEKSVCMGTKLWSKAAYWESPVLASLSCCAAWESWKAASGWAESGRRVHSRSSRSATPFRSSQNPNANAVFLRRFSS